MKCYLLLRDNVETGPYDLAEISTRQLLPTDLIWVEGSSHSWRFPAEIAELAHLVQHQQPEPATKGKTDVSGNIPESKNVFVALPQPQVALTALHPVDNMEDAELETSFVQPLDELKAKYEAFQQQRRFQFSRKGKNSNVIWMAALFAGLLGGAFMIKKMVDAAGDKEGRSLASAALPAKAFPNSSQKEADAAYSNALSTEMVPVDTTAEKPIEVKKKVNLKKLVTLSASEFKKGVFGGINDLELKVRNKSDHVLDKVAIEVAYLKPNGEVIKKENYTLKAVAPKSTKNLVIPPSKRGVDIKYRITNIKSHDANMALREL